MFVRVRDMGAVKSEMYNALTIVILAGRDWRLEWALSEPSGSAKQAGIPVKILKRCTASTAYARLAESVRPLCSRHCNSRLSLLKCLLCAWRYNRETRSSAFRALVPFGANCLEQFACPLLTNLTWAVRYHCVPQTETGLLLITVSEAYMAYMMNRKRKPKRLVQG